MRSLVLGASGGIGRHIVRIASEKGHQVTALVRQGQAALPSVRMVQDDIQRPGCLLELVHGHDVVLSALGLRKIKDNNPFSPLASPEDFTSATARLLVSAMDKSEVRRVIAVSAAGVGDSFGGLNLFMRVMIATSTVGKMYKDLNAMEQVYSSSGLDWCCVRPTGLRDGPQTDEVSLISNFPLTAGISRADVASWMVTQAAAPVIENRTPIMRGPR